MVIFNCNYFIITINLLTTRLQQHVFEQYQLYCRHYCHELAIPSLICDIYSNLSHETCRMLTIDCEFLI